jgi:hypothetical protein
VTSGWQTLTGGRRSVTSGLPAPDTCSLTTSHRPLTTCRWPPAPRPPITGRWPRVTNQRSPTTGHWPLVTGHCPPIRARASPRVPPIPPEISRRQCPGRRRCSIRWLSRHPQESCRKYRKGNGAAFREYAGCNDCANSVSNRHPRDESHIVGSGSRSYEVPTLSATDTSAMSARQLVRRKQERGTSSPVVTVA